MPSCSIYSCKKRSLTSSLRKNNVTFHLFPKEPYRREIWTQATGKHETWAPKRTSTICPEHFEISCFRFNHCSKNKRNLHNTAVPTLKIYKAPGPLQPVSEAETGVTQHCCVPHCESYERDGLQFYRFPVDQILRTGWEEAVGKSSTEHSRVCSKHFVDTDIVSVPKRSLPSQLPIWRWTKHYAFKKVTRAVCMKCETELDPTEAAKIGEDKVKAVIAKVYHFLEKDYKELKEKYKGLDFKHLSKFKRRTAEATGVYQKAVETILKEEKERKITQNGSTKKPIKVDQDDHEIISV